MCTDTVNNCTDCKVADADSIKHVNLPLKQSSGPQFIQTMSIQVKMVETSSNPLFELKQLKSHYWQPQVSGFGPSKVPAPTRFIDHIIYNI